jgi:hypothetical protein
VPTSQKVETESNASHRSRDSQGKDEEAVRRQEIDNATMSAAAQNRADSSAATMKPTAVSLII